MKESMNKTCRFCGKPIAIITWGVYRKAVVDAVPVWVEANPEGEDYIRIDGSKVRGFEVDYISDSTSEPAYRMHGKSCGKAPS